MPPPNPPILTVSTALRKQIDDAISNLPAAHRTAPKDGEIVADKELGYTRCQDWAFTEGFALATVSNRAHRLRLACVHHGDDTRDYRKLGEDRKRKGKIQAKGCKFEMYISFRTKTNSWGIGYTHREHSHDPSPDPFQYSEHASKRPGHYEALAMAKTLVGDVPYLKANRIMTKSGLYLSHDQFRNLKTKDKGSNSLTRKEQLDLLLHYLQEDADWRVRFKAKYVHDKDGKVVERVIQALMFCSKEQIYLARRFVSEFIYILDATFNTSSHNLPLEILCGIDNTDTTFPFLYIYEMSESAEIFAWINDELTEMIFYDIQGPGVQLGDWAGGVTAAANQFNELEMVAAAEEGREPQICQVQRCTWHAEKAIEKKLVHAGKYSKQRRQEIVGYIWDWIKESTVTGMQERRERLVEELGQIEKTYLRTIYQPKEAWFCHAYTLKYPNLDCFATSRCEGHHPRIHDVTHRQSPIEQSVRNLRDYSIEVIERYNSRINQNRKSVPLFIDRAAFSRVVPLLTHEALTHVSREWTATKELSRKFESGDTEAEERFLAELGSPECLSECRLPLVYGLPCRHWLWTCYEEKEPIPPEFFHPRWFLDPLTPVDRPWAMGESMTPPKKDDELLSLLKRDGLHSTDLAAFEEDRSALLGDRYRNQGDTMMQATGQSLQDAYAGLKGPQKEEFAKAFRELGNKLLAAQSKKDESYKALPLMLPPAQKKANVLPFPKTTKKRRAMTGLEEAEEKERREELRRKATAKEATFRARELDLQREKRAGDGDRVLEEAEDEDCGGDGGGEVGVGEEEEEEDEVIDLTTLGHGPQDSPRRSSLSDDDEEDEEEEVDITSPRRSGRVRKPSAKQVSQLRREREAKEAKEAIPKGRKVKKSKLRDTSQLEDYML